MYDEPFWGRTTCNNAILGMSYDNVLGIPNDTLCYTGTNPKAVNLERAAERSKQQQELLIVCTPPERDPPMRRVSQG